MPCQARLAALDEGIAEVEQRIAALETKWGGAPARFPVSPSIFECHVEAGEGAAWRYEKVPRLRTIRLVFLAKALKQ